MTNQPTYDLASLVGTEMTAEQVRLILSDALGGLGSLEEDEFTAQNVERWLRAIANKRGIDPSQIRRPLLIVFQGHAGSDGLYETMAIMGKQQTLKLIAAALRSLTDRANS